MPKDTDIEPSKPLPEILSDMELALTVPETEPDALKVRSSQSPEALEPWMRSLLRM